MTTVLPNEQWPLRRLNLIVLPVAIVLALRASWFWWSLLAAAAVGFVAALVLAMLWIGESERS
jgi:hypothetical protein